jgi:copper chaperone
MQTLKIQIDGMSCGHCLNAVRSGLSEAEGVQVDSVQMGNAVVTYDEKITDPSKIEAVIAELGYSASALSPK